MLNDLRCEMADVTVEEQRTVINFYVKLGKTQKKTNDDSHTVYYGDYAITYHVTEMFLVIPSGMTILEKYLSTRFYFRCGTRTSRNFAIS